MPANMPVIIVTGHDHHSGSIARPKMGLGMDAGKGVECLQPVRPGKKLIGRTHVHDIYTKTGRSGRMVFAVSRIEFYDEDGNHLANSDSRVVMREKSK